MIENAKTVESDLRSMGLPEDVCNVCISGLYSKDDRWKKSLSDYRSKILDIVHENQDIISKIDFIYFQIEQTKKET